MDDYSDTGGATLLDVQKFFNIDHEKMNVLVCYALERWNNECCNFYEEVLKFVAYECLQIAINRKRDDKEEVDSNG